MKLNRKLWFPILAGVLLVGIVAGLILAPRFLPSDPVPVYAVSMVGYTDFYSGNSESYGMVTTDKVQTAFVSDTQTITEILVYEGQQVKKGDVLYTYDTTLSDLALERKDLSIQQMEVTLKTAQAELKALKAMKPISYKENTSVNKNKYTTSPADVNLLGTVYSSTTGRSRTSPLYFWMEEGSGAMSSVVSEALIDYLFTQASGSEPDKIYVVFQSSDGNKPNVEFESQYGVCFTKMWKQAPVTPPPTDPTDPVNPSEPTDPITPTNPTQPSEPTEPSVPAEPTEPTDPPTEPTQPETPPEEPPADPQPPVEEPGTGEGSGDAQAAAILASTAQPDTIQTTTAPTEKVFDGYALSFFEPSSVIQDNSSIEWNDGFTSAELSAMRAEKQAEITQLQFDIKMGKAELKIMQKEADSGQVLAQFDGTVTGVTEPLTAMELNVPLMKLIGGGGYYVEGSVSELDLSSIQVGQTISVTAWDTGETLQGTVVEVGNYPAEDQGYGNAGVSFYPYRVFIDQSANLMEGFYVSMTVQSAEAADGVLYLQNAFLRKDGNRTYLYVRDAEGLLEKRYVEAGVSHDGYMTPIYSGLTESDFVAFPYGNDVSEDAPTREGAMDELYGY